VVHDFAGQKVVAALVEKDSPTQANPALKVVRRQFTHTDVCRQARFAKGLQQITQDCLCLGLLLSIEFG
jgi:hypothetical protein